MFVKYGNAQVKKHPNGVCKNCGVPLQSDDVKFCSECTLIRNVPKDVNTDSDK